ncbi:hypothetical protein MUN88_21030 [Gracilibacillus caseinilyticus]|uniref:Uncharacterized protein n=1 Tax=Gracilibacillus caseinilyticus TaxID=2932256 RepID=A0ABY4EXB1_9BACI|nr:hypothetical protein [Gracilibacillus caseinilyticus]UOQ48483.1 hypothetical protein MUN88_21030 [Gracilibacillus caseinilyticus]
MKKKWLSIFAVAMLSASFLTACAEEGEGDTEEPETEDATTDENEETTDEATE